MVLMLGLVSPAGAQVTPGAIWALNAADNPGDLSGYTSLASNFSAPGYGTEAVPEPTAFCLLVMGILFFATSRV
ncbi:MAG: hypothetical protein CMJ81_12220 [Planctomycetaceae bacterium]|nr:hypothetical protein [Planctomycetaceae bacterium]MBP60428.1 hypothetical protein [Planctomycetaceae bacterium]